MSQDPLHDPRFPNRPGHPDFWRLVAAVNYLDGEALEGGRSVPEIIGQYVDEESLAYMSQQRFMRAISVMDEETNFQSVALALYMDAFALGCQFTKEANHKEE